MRIQTHEKILRIVFRARRKKVEVIYCDDNEPRLEGYEGKYLFKEKKILINKNHSSIVFTLAHEFVHYWQYQSFNKFIRYKKYIRKYNQIPTEDTFLNFRRYKYSCIEREADYFAFIYCLFTGEFKVFWEAFKDEVSIFIDYFLGFYFVKKGYRKIKDWFKSNTEKRIKDKKKQKFQTVK